MLKIGNKIMLDILLFIWIFGTLFMPYIVEIAIYVIIIFLIRKKLKEKNKNFYIRNYKILNKDTKIQIWK